MKQTLNLTIQRKWFDLIAQGVKTEEYRDHENRQVARAYITWGNDPEAHENAVAVFRNGYTMQSPALAVEIVGFDLRYGYEAQHPEWGEPLCRKSHLVIKLGKVLAKGDYAAVKRWAEKEGGEG